MFNIKDRYQAQHQIPKLMTIASQCFVSNPTQLLRTTSITQKKRIQDIEVPTSWYR